MLTVSRKLAATISVGFALMLCVSVDAEVEGAGLSRHETHR